jgi:hypothetical protein
VPAIATNPPRPVLLLREGFCPGAFLFGPAWLAARGMWLEAVINLGALALIIGLLPGAAIAPAVLGLQFLLGAEARDLRRAALLRRGWAEAGPVAARDEEEALTRLVAARPDLAPGLARGGFA